MSSVVVVRFSFGEVCGDALWLAMVSSVVAELKNKASKVFMACREETLTKDASSKFVLRFRSDINCGDNDICM